MRYSLLLATFFGTYTLPSTAIAQEATTQAVTSGIQITASSKANVYIDNELVGETPYQVSVNPGDYTIRLSADGFDPFTRRVTVQRNAISTINASLDVGGGTVEFQANPSNAQLQLDGGSERYILPIRFDELKTGRHTWEIHAKGHDSIAGEFSFAEGQNIFVYHQLESSLGKASFRSNPEGASVWLDGEEIGVTPLDLTDLDPAKHSISFQQKGYASVFRTIDTSAGERGDVKAAMTKIGCNVKINTGIANAEVFIEDTPIASGRTVNAGKLEKGAYSVRILADGYKTLQSDITVPASGRIKYKATLVPAGESGTPELAQRKSNNANINWKLWGSIGAGAVLTATGSYFIAQAFEPEPAPSGDTVVTLP